MEIQHQEIQKQQQKSLHDKSIKNKNLSVGDLTLLYNSRVKGKPKKFTYIMDGTLRCRRDSCQLISLTKDVTRNNIWETC